MHIAIIRELRSGSFYLFALVGGVLLHAGANLISEYNDFKNKVDRIDTLGGSRVLIEGLIEPKKVYWAGVLCLFIAFLLGLIMIYYRGLPLLYLGLVGIVFGYFYTFFKSHALGDAEIFIMFVQSWL